MQMQRGGLVPSGRDAASATLVHTPGLNTISKMLLKFKTVQRFPSREMSQLEENFHQGHKILLWLNMQALPGPIGTLIPKGSAATTKNAQGCHGFLCSPSTPGTRVCVREGWGGSESCNFRYFNAQSEGNVSILVGVHSLPSAAWAVEKRW